MPCLILKKKYFKWDNKWQGKNNIWQCLTFVPAKKKKETVCQRDGYSIDTVITFAACLGARKKDMEDEGRLHKYIEDIYKTIVLVISS